jgi:thiol-disulfide isomerase/thioredoxin
LAAAAQAQEVPRPSLNVGDPAPPLKVRGWIKGAPIQQFEKGKVYVVEFWATWCRPCIAGMPHISALAEQYRDKVIVFGVDIYESKTASLAKIKAFVDSMGNRMDYRVAAEDRDSMETGWLDAFGDKNKGIPISFVVNEGGRVAWIGYPTKLDEVLRKIVNKSWDIKEALAKRNSDKYLAALDDSLSYELMVRRGDPEKLSNFGHPDSALFMIDEMVRKEPRLRYAPRIAFYTFSSLLQIDQQKAYAYGKELLVTPTYDDPACDVLIDVIQLYSYKLNLRSEVYELCAEAYQGKIDEYPQSDDLPNSYHKMAEWYWRACDRPKAIASEQKAIEAMKGKSGRAFSAADLAVFESRLKQYRQ